MNLFVYYSPDPSEFPLQTDTLIPTPHAATTHAPEPANQPPINWICTLLRRSNRLRLNSILLLFVSYLSFFLFFFFFDHCIYLFIFLLLWWFYVNSQFHKSPLLPEYHWCAGVVFLSATPPWHFSFSFEIITILLTFHCPNAALTGLISGAMEASTYALKSNSGFSLQNRLLPSNGGFRKQSLAFADCYRRMSNRNNCLGLSISSTSMGRKDGSIRGLFGSSAKARSVRAQASGSYVLGLNFQ